MPNNYNSSYTGQHNDQYEERITDLGNRITDLESYLNGTKAISHSLLLQNGFKTGLRASNTSATGSIMIEANGGIELYHNSTPFIDFHYANDASDYSGRFVFIGDHTFSIDASRLQSSYANSTSWDKTRDASFRSLTSSSDNGAKGHYMLKTRSGSWTLSDYSDEGLYFVYCTDANYSASNNTTVRAKINSSGAFVNYSKREFKENIELVDYSCLDIINSIRICSFNMKGDAEKDYRIGFIADDTDARVAGKNHDIMDLQNCIGVLIKAVQELSQEVEKLKKRLGE